MQSRDIAHQIIETIAGYTACAVQINTVKGIHNISMIGDLKIRNDGLAVFLDLHIVCVIGTDRNRGIDDIRDHHHILKDDLIRFLLNGIELFQALSHFIDLRLYSVDLCHLGGILLGLAHQSADLLGEFLSLCAKLIRLTLSRTALLIIFDHFIDKGEFHILKLLANILFDNFRILSQKLNINHSLSPSFVPALFPHYCAPYYNMFPINFLFIYIYYRRFNCQANYMILSALSVLSSVKDPFRLFIFSSVNDP